MKTANLLLTMFGFGVLSIGLSFAGEPPRQLSGLDTRENLAANNRPSDPLQRNLARGKRDQSHVTAENGRARMSSLPKRSGSNDFRRFGLDKTTAANDELKMNKMGSRREPPARLPISSGMPRQSPHIARDRGAAATTIGGSATPSAKHSAAVITGTGIRRKP